LTGFIGFNLIGKLTVKRLRLQNIITVGAEKYNNELDGIAQ
jgi:hypothetical protein